MASEVTSDLSVGWDLFFEGPRFCYDDAGRMILGEDDLECIELRLSEAVRDRILHRYGCVPTDPVGAALSAERITALSLIRLAVEHPQAEPLYTLALVMLQLAERIGAAAVALTWPAEEDSPLDYSLEGMVSVDLVVSPVTPPGPSSSSNNVLATDEGHTSGWDVHFCNTRIDPHEEDPDHFLDQVDIRITRAAAPLSAPVSGSFRLTDLPRAIQQTQDPTLSRYATSLFGVVCHTYLVAAELSMGEAAADSPLTLNGRLVACLTAARSVEEPTAQAG